MKTNIILAIAIPMAMVMAGCGNSKPKDNPSEKQDQTEVTNQEAETQPEVAPEEEKVHAFPWDYPEGVKSEGLDQAQTVLSIHSFYPQKLKESNDPANETYIFYNAALDSVGETKSTVKQYGDKIEMPNSLIIPIVEGQKAKKGDIVLTWWQSGSGMQRALVTNASDPTSPKVDYLDLNYKDDGSGIANTKADEQIKPNTFVVLNDGAWQPGAQIVVTGDESYTAGTLISSTDDKILLKTFGGKIQAFKKADCKVVPLNQNLKPGDAVRGIFTTSYNDGYTVKKVDTKIGRVWVEGKYGDKILSILEVYKE